MALALLFTPPFRHDVLAGLTLDASGREEHTLEATVTEHPVKGGSQVADHIALQPERLTIEGLITESPVGFGTRRVPGLPEGDVGTVPISWLPLFQTGRSRALVELVDAFVGLQIQHPDDPMASLPVTEASQLILQSIRAELASLAASGG